MKKNIKSLLYLSAVGVLSLSTACSDTYEQFTVDGEDPYSVNKVYMYQPNETFATLPYKANGDFINETPSIINIMPVRTTKAAPADLNVKIGVDPDLVSEYNEAQGTNFVLFKSVEILNPSILIKEGEYISQDTIKIKITDPKEFQNGNENFIIPIVITDSDNRNVRISKSSRVFLTFNSELKPNVIQMYNINPYYQVKYHYQTGKPVNGLEELASPNLTSYIGGSFETFEDVDVQLRINNDLIASSSYPSYNPVPQVRLKEEKVTIKKGQTQVPFSLVFDDAMMSLTPSTYYLIPVEIVSVNGLGNEIGSNKVAWVRLTYTTFTPTQVCFYYVSSTAVTSYTVNVANGQPQNPLSELNTKIRLYASANVASDPLTAIIKINNDLIDSYNKSNGTNYVAAPEGSVGLVKDVIKVGNGTSGYYSADSLKLSFPDRMKNFEVGKTYLVPVELAEIVEKDKGTVRTTTSTNYQTVINVILSVQEPPKYGLVSTLNDIDGVEMSDRSGVKAFYYTNTNPGATTDMTDVVVGTRTYLSFPSPATKTIVVDLGKECNLNGFSIPYYSSSYGFKQIQLEISEDNESWTNLGTSDTLAALSIHYFKFDSTKAARYIRVKPLQAQGSSCYLGSSSGNPGWRYMIAD